MHVKTKVKLFSLSSVSEPQRYILESAWSPKIAYKLYFREYGIGGKSLETVPLILVNFKPSLFTTTSARMFRRQWGRIST